MMDPPDRVPSARLSLQSRQLSEFCSFLGFCHSLAFILNHARHEITVGDTIDGHWHRVADPSG